MPSCSDETRRIFYGRRYGRKLRPQKRQLVEALLPQVAVDPAALAASQGDIGTLFEPPAGQVWLEIGFGGGEHIAAQARSNPEIGLIGCEPFVNGVASLLDEMARENTRNIRIFADDARILLDALPENSISRCFVLFPDPWPKLRHNRRRFVSRENLDTLARVLQDGAELRVASDHSEYIRWILFQTLRHDAFEWLARGTADWRIPPPDWKRTRYEEKALAKGDRCTYLRFRRNNRR